MVPIDASEQHPVLPTETARGKLEAERETLLGKIHVSQGKFLARAEALYGLPLVLDLPPCDNSGVYEYGTIEISKGGESQTYTGLFGGVDLTDNLEEYEPYGEKTYLIASDGTLYEFDKKSGCLSTLSLPVEGGGSYPLFTGSDQDRILSIDQKDILRKDEPLQLSDRRQVKFEIKLFSHRELELTEEVSELRDFNQMLENNLSNAKKLANGSALPE